MAAMNWVWRVLVVSVLSTAACTEEPPPAEPSRATIFESQTQALERAKQVEQVIQQGAAQQRTAIDEAAR